MKGNIALMCPSERKKTTIIIKAREILHLSPSFSVFFKLSNLPRILKEYTATRAIQLYFHTAQLTTTQMKHLHSCRRAIIFIEMSRVIRLDRRGIEKENLRRQNGKG